MAELREVECETREQQTDVTDITAEVEDHRERARELEEAVGHLRAAREGLRSEGLDTALKDAADAKAATEARLEELREQKEDMLRRNDEMADRCRESARRKRQALEKMPLLLRAGRASGAESRAASPFYQGMQDELQADLRRTEDAERELGQVRRALEGLDV